jgi:hypothetical protein
MPMKKVSSNLYHFLIKAFLGLMVLFVLLLCISAFFLTSYADKTQIQVALIRPDNIFLNLLGMIILFCIFYRISIFASQKPKTRKRLFLIIVLGWYLVGGFLLTFFGRSAPAADSMSIYYLAVDLARGENSVIHPITSYISYYPQQVGLVAFYEICIRFWNSLGIPLAVFHFLKCLNIFFACIMIFCQYQAVHLLFKNDKADSFYLCLAGANLPLLFYTSFVYGEVPSLALFFAGFWILLTTRGTKGMGFLIRSLSSCILLAFSVLLRKNMLIPIIALLLVMLIDSLRLKKIRLLFLAISLAILSTLLPKLTESYYENRSGYEISSGVPPLTYIAMGMQESSSGSGWYNGYNLETYQNNDMDTALTNAESLHEIAARLNEWKSRPLQALSFYNDKYLTQWTDGTYACRQSTLATFGGRAPIIQSIYDGDLSSFLIEGCNILQNLLYLGCLLFICSVIKARSLKTTAKDDDFLWIRADLFPYVGLLAAFGGFVFHMLWEANSRYIFPYSILLLPYAAWGLSRIPMQKIVKKGKQIISGYKYRS